MSDVSAAIRAATERLKAGADPATARLDAELLAAHVAGSTREEFLLDPPPAIEKDTYDALVARRAAGEPLAHITGRAEFWSLPLLVTPDTLVPRPDSESLIELALERVKRPRTVVDLGTGSGCLLLAALTEFDRAEGLGIDASPAAVQVAAQNAQALGFADRAAFLVADWSVLSEGDFDLILCNPPYIAEGDPALGAGVADYEPAEALFADDAGMAAYPSAFAVVARTLSAKGTAIFEIGADREAEVTAAAKAHGLRKLADRADLGGHVRALAFGR